MKALIVYESMFGNTGTVARTIAKSLTPAFEVTLAHVSERPSPTGTDLLVVGAPTHAMSLSRPATRQEAGRLGPLIAGAGGIGLREYLDGLPPLPGLPAVAFDCRSDKPMPNSAARSAHRRLRRLGCWMLLPAQSFRVGSALGPLLDGELPAAAAWGASLSDTLAAAQRV